MRATLVQSKQKYNKSNNKTIKLDKIKGLNPYNTIERNKYNLRTTNQDRTKREEEKTEQLFMKFIGYSKSQGPDKSKNQVVRT